MDKKDNEFQTATEKARQLLSQLVADDTAFVSTLCILQSELGAMISLDPLQGGDKLTGRTGHVTAILFL